MSNDIVNIEVDGKAVEARRGQMIMEVTDGIGIYIPRFCYHEKLSIAANCRMCLVEVENAPKPMPACATPVGEGMKVFTRSPAAISAQKATMEFLLINHPLDCPICDQGGECELQDLALGYGRDVSRYNEGKRVVKDKDLGPLVSTDMTRCIHCTRCVRFSQEIQGLQELGTIGRAEDMQISMYIDKSVDHELSANIIDVCPVGALNNKPYRYSARAWEMEQRPTVSPHDCVGSNMYAHVLRGTIKRVVPCENEDINETWLSDRDRFGYQGIYSNDRLLTPRVKQDGAWQDIGWEDALGILAEKLQGADAEKIGILSSPAATIEENHLLARLAEHIGTANIDHRIRQRDFSDQDDRPAFPYLGSSIAELEANGAILVVGSNLRKEAPIIAHRVRKAALAGSKVSFVNNEAYEYHFDVEQNVHDAGLVEQLAGVAVAAAGGQTLPKSVQALLQGVTPSAAQQSIAASLAAAEQAQILLGLIADRHQASSALWALASVIGNMTGASIGTLSEGANSAGACLAGVLPHRASGGNARKDSGLHAGNMLDESLAAVLLVGVEPDRDICSTDDAVVKLAGQKFVAALTSYDSEALQEAADLLLPIGTFAESAGTYVNCEGRWQSFNGIASPPGESRPAWKVLRVLGNLLDAADFDYQTSAEIRDELATLLGDINPHNHYLGKNVNGKIDVADDPAARIDIPIYRTDAVVRRATALQLTAEAQRNACGAG